MSKKSDSIMDLLPEGLNESTVNEIARLVDEVIAEQVEDKVRNLETKVHGFLRLKIDELKEHAELELENSSSSFRNAKLFESIRTLMAMELHQDDENSAVSEVLANNEKLSEEVNVLTSELERALSGNNTLETTVTVLSKKIDLLESKASDLVEENQLLEESQPKPFKSSEKAVMVSEELHKTRQNSNEFLTEEVMRYMPFNS